MAIGPNATLYFEDNLIMHYQIQEMLRAERIFEANAINDELAVYNELIPDGNNWKATFMIEFADEGERRLALSKMFGIEELQDALDEVNFQYQELKRNEYNLMITSRAYFKAMYGEKPEAFEMQPTFDHSKKKGTLYVKAK